MARRNRIFNGITKVETTVRFTAAEELARDLEEKTAKDEDVKAAVKDQAVASARSKIKEGATLADVIRFLALSPNS